MTDIFVPVLQHDQTLLNVGKNDENNLISIFSICPDRASMAFVLLVLFSLFALQFIPLVHVTLLEEL